jgi:spore germination cell wall hydrolase CwlJ-like protein
VISLMCLATAIYFESRSEPLEGQYAVAEVIMNRAGAEQFPDTVCGVISEDKGPKPHDCQFSFTCDGKPEDIQETGAFVEAVVVAYDVLYVQDAPQYVDDALYFHAAGVSPSWARSMEVTAEIGEHVFLSEDDS